MALKPRVKAVPHLFMGGDTVSGAIKKYNLYDVTKEEMVGLLSDYRSINTAEIMRPGTRVMIPILERHASTVFG